MSDAKGGDFKLCVESKGIYSEEKRGRSEGKDCDDDNDAKGEYLDDGKSLPEFDYPNVDITALTILPIRGILDGPLELALSFTLDRDVVAGYWYVISFGFFITTFSPHVLALCQCPQISILFQ